MPLVPWTGATPRSGIAVAASLFGDGGSPDADRMALAIAHEVGHALGLFHSKEDDRFGADIADPIADTDDVDGSDNLMFFDVNRISDVRLSPGQGRTIRRGAQVLP